MSLEPFYWTSENALRRFYRERARQMAFGGVDEAQAKEWQQKARKQLASLLGLEHFERTLPQARLLHQTEVETGIRREKWLVQTAPDVWVPFYLLIPNAPGPLALVLCPHGHGTSGKEAIAGCVELPFIAEATANYNCDYGLQVARLGAIAVCPDARGFGERREPAVQGTTEEAVLASSCSHLALSGMPLGLTVQGMWTWDLMRLLDWVLEDRRVDEKRVACIGLSGGGQQTLNLAALDERVKAAVVSGYFYGVRESLQELNANCLCNLVPHLWEWFDMGDIAALIAPRALFIETGDQDPLNGRSGVANVLSQIEIARRAFDALGGELEHHVFEGGHKWNGTRSLPWLVQTVFAHSEVVQKSHSDAVR